MASDWLDVVNLDPGRRCEYFRVVGIIVMVE